MRSVAAGGGQGEKERERSREIEIPRETPQEWGQRERESSGEAKIKNQDLIPTPVLLHNAPFFLMVIIK